MAKPLAWEPDGPAGELYERDFYTWALRQAELVRARRLEELDLENVAEELESLGKEQAHKLESSFRVLLLHLLKWRYQPRRRSRSWRTSVVRERINIERLLAENTLSSHACPRYTRPLTAALAREAAAETGSPIARFPEQSPFTLEKALDEEFWLKNGSP